MCDHEYFKKCDIYVHSKVSLVIDSLYLSASPSAFAPSIPILLSNIKVCYYCGFHSLFHRKVELSK